MSREELNKFYDDVMMMIDNFFKPTDKNLTSIDDSKDYLKETIKNYKLSE